MLRSLLYILFAIFILLCIANYSVLNSSANGLEHAAKFGRCLMEASKTKIDCGYEPSEHFKSPAVASGLVWLLAISNLAFLILVAIVAFWIRFKSPLNERL